MIGKEEKSTSGQYFLLVVINCYNTSGPGISNLNVHTDLLRMLLKCGFHVSDKVPADGILIKVHFPPPHPETSLLSKALKMFTNCPKADEM